MLFGPLLLLLSSCTQFPTTVCTPIRNNQSVQNTKSLISVYLVHENWFDSFKNRGGKSKFHFPLRIGEFQWNLSALKNFGWAFFAYSFSSLDQGWQSGQLGISFHFTIAWHESVCYGDTNWIGFNSKEKEMKDLKGGSLIDGHKASFLAKWQRWPQNWKGEEPQVTGWSIWMPWKMQTTII